MATGSGVCTAQENLTAEAIWARGNTVILFARFHKCGELYIPVQPLVSTDGGKTWVESGPRFIGDDLKYILDTGANLWIAGENYIEGPTHDPFLLLFRADGAEWPAFDIYNGDSELLRIAFDTRRARLLAWVRHIDLRSDNWTGPIYLHQSMDEGRTWSTIKRVRRIPRSASGLRFFKKLPRQNGPWRISRLGSSVEHQGPDGAWQQVTELPLPVQQRCLN